MMPPIKQTDVAGSSGGGAPAPAPGTAPATSGGGPDSSAAGAAGQAAAGAGALGGGLGGVLQQLVDALKALTSALGGGVPGGGPIQQGPPVVQGGGATNDPIVAQEQRIQRELAKPTLPAQIRAELNSVLQELAQARTAAQTSGSYDPGTMTRTTLLTDRAFFAPGSAARTKLDALLGELQAARGRSPVINPAFMQRVLLEAAVLSRVSPERMPAAQTLVAQLKVQEASQAPLDPVKLQQQELQISALVGA